MVVLFSTTNGKGNVMICSSDVASALAMAGLLDYQSALNSQISLTVDDTGNTFAGTLFGRIKVYIDPYFSFGTVVRIEVRAELCTRCDFVVYFIEVAKVFFVGFSTR